MLSRRHPPPLGNLISPNGCSRRKRSKGSNFILLNGEQGTPDAAVALGADKENFLQQTLNAEFKSRKQFPSDSFLQPHYLLYFPNTAIRYECFLTAALWWVHQYDSQPSFKSKSSCQRHKQQFTSISSIRNKHRARKSLVTSSHIFKILYTMIKKSTTVWVAKVC